MIDEDKQGAYERGIRAFRNKEYETAIEYLSNAVEYDEKNDKAWNALGTACAKIGRHSDADLCFENALTVSPENETYIKNRLSNAKKLDNPPVMQKAKAGSILDLLPLDRIPVDRTYLLVGIGVVAVLLIGLILFFTLFSTPAAPPGPPLQLSANLSGNTVVLTNGGGKDIGKVTAFSWKINGKPIGTGTPGAPTTLAVKPGSSASVPLADIAETNLSGGMQVVVIATLKEGGAMVALSTTLPPPPPGLLPTIAPVVTATPPPPPARFNPGEVVFDEKTGSYILIMSKPLNGTYFTTRAARAPNGSFVAMESGVTNTSVPVIEQTARLLGTRAPGGTPPGLSSLGPPPVIEIPAMHPEPVFQAGDLVNMAESGDSGMLIILGYDATSDQYQADTITRYYSGEWGYRMNSTPKWFVRPVLEGKYQHRIDRIATSDIGIGADSAPPRNPVKYHQGDIISRDKAGLDEMMIITGYAQANDTYMINTVRNAYDGGWIMPGTSHEEKRAYIERDYPYLLKSVDLSLVKTV